MPKSPEQISIERLRAKSDEELIRGGASIEVDEEGDSHLAATEEQKRAAKNEIPEIREKKREEIIKKFIGVDEYIDDIIDADEVPEAYIWNGRRILRSTIQTLFRELKKTGNVAKANDNLTNAPPAGYMEKLATKNPDYEQFVEALNNVMEQYKDLFEGSEKIGKTNKKVTVR